MLKVIKNTTENDNFRHPLSFRSIYHQTWLLFKRGFWLFFLLGLVTECLIDLIFLIHKVWFFPLWITILLILFLGVIGKAWIMSNIYKTMKSDQKILLRQASGIGNINILSLVGATILVKIFNSFGFILFIIPGIIFYFLNYLYLPIIVDEKASALNSIKRSWQLMRLHFFKASWIIFCFLLGSVGLNGLASYIVLHSHSVIFVSGVLLMIFVGTLTLAFGSILSVILHLKLKHLYQQLPLNE